MLLKKLKDDKEVALAAVKQNGLSLEYTSDKLCNDKEGVLEAVKQNGTTLGFASERLKCDREIIFASIEQNEYSLEYVSETLLNNLDFLNLIVDKFHIFFLEKNGLKDIYDDLNLKKDMALDLNKFSQLRTKIKKF